MSSLIQLAADFFDRMSNPVFGAEANEEAALTFASLRDEELDERLRYEAAQLRARDSLTSYGWLWLLGWADSTNTQLDGQLLLDLCETWESASFKAAVITTATLRAEWRNIGTSDLDNFPDPWLRRLLQRAVGTLDTDDGRGPSGGRRHSRHVESLVIALLLVDRPPTIDAASALLRHQWGGQRSLLHFFWSRMDMLDQETRAAWETSLTPPPRPDRTDQ